MALCSQRLNDLPENIDVYSRTFKIGQSTFTSNELKVLDEITVSGWYVPVIDEVLKTEKQHPKEESMTEGSNDLRVYSCLLLY